MGREQVHPDPAGETGGESAAPRGIVVGVDGSDHSQCALVWAAREAERRQRPLHIVTAYSVPIFAASGLDGGYATVDDSVIREGAEAILKQAMDKVAGYNIDVDASVENGDASGVLLEMTETAELLVFGTRGRGGFVGRLLGSVSSALPAHAKCPTVTVPLICADRLGETTEDKHVLAERAKSGRQPVENVVVVGVDGSEQARVAVLEAAAQAERLSAPLRRGLRRAAIHRFAGMGAHPDGPRGAVRRHQGPARRRRGLGAGATSPACRWRRSSWTARPSTSSSRPAGTWSSSSSEPAGAGDSPECCWDPRPTASCTTPRAPSWWSRTGTIPRLADRASFGPDARRS